MNDFRLAIRTLRMTPVASILVLLSLALGIGANTAIFSLVSSVMLRSLPVDHPERLAILTSGASATRTWSYAIWQELRQRQLFDGEIAWMAVNFNLSTSGEVQPVQGILVNGDYFRMLGVPALLGRTIAASDDLRGGGPDGPVAVISHAFWRRHFGAAASALGTSITVEGTSFTIVGVTPPEFFGAEVGRWFDIAVPIGTEPIMRGRNTALDQPASFWLNVMIRLKPGQSKASATETLRAVQPEIRAASMPPNADGVQRASFIKEPFSLSDAATGFSPLRREYTRPLLTVFVIAALALLIACANIGNLLLARAGRRHQELSLRIALGASRWRLFRLLFAESLVLALVGIASGLLIGPWASRVLIAQLATTATPVVLDLSLDWRMLTFATGISLGTVLLFGTAPAFRGSHIAPVEALRQWQNGFKRRVAGQGPDGISGVLIVVQVALSLVLVVAAGLLVSTFTRLISTPLGLDADRVIVANINATRSSTPLARRLELYQRIADAVAAVPGVARASGSLLTPATGQNWTAPLNVAGAQPLSDTERTTSINIVTPRWFATYGIRLLSGRDFEAGDRVDSERVAIVNESFAARFFPDGNAIGGLVTFPAISNVSSHEPRAIIGIVSDAIYSTVRNPQRPTLYEPLAQNDWPFPFAGISLSARSAEGSPLKLAPSIGSAITTVDPQLAFSIRTVSDQVNTSLTQERMVAMLSGFFSLSALLLAGLGLYGVTSQAVTSRRIEIGIRMALGADQSAVVWLVVKRVAILVTLGIVAGAGLSLWTSRYIASLLHGVEPRDPVTLLGGALTLVGVAIVAGWMPAYRATRVDPAQTLRAG